MQITYSPVKYLRAEKEHDEHAKELAAQGIDESAKLSFGVPQKTQSQLQLEKDAMEMANIQAQLDRLEVEKERWKADLKQDAKEEKMRATKAGVSGLMPEKANESKMKRPLPSKPKKKKKQVNHEIELNSTANMIDCPNCCGMMIRIQDVPKHENSCTHRTVTCPEPGCMDKVLFCDIALHKRTSCKVAMHRRTLLEEKAVREREDERKAKEAAESPQKRKPKSAEQLLREKIDAERVANSRAREIMSRELRQMRMEDHRTSRREFDAQFFDPFENDPNLEERAEKARRRQDEVECPNCGEPVVAMWLQKHIKTLCLNRRVPCRNWELGCPAMVRLRDRINHETVDHLLKPRSCLRLTGNTGYIDINEDEDIRPPWTAEFWVYRAPTLECAITTCRKAMEAKGEKEKLQKIAEESNKNLQKGEEMLAELAMRVAKKRTTEIMKEKEKVTEQLIIMAKENEDKIRAAAHKKVVFRMLIKDASRLCKDMDKEKVNYDLLVNDLGPEESDAVVEVEETEEEKARKADELALSKITQEEREAVLRYRKMLETKKPLQAVEHMMVQEGMDKEYLEALVFPKNMLVEEEQAVVAEGAKIPILAEETKRSETETNTPNPSVAADVTFDPNMIPKTPDVPYSTQLDSQIEGTPPATAASSNRPFTATDKMAPPPPIDWHGDGTSFVQYIHTEALQVSMFERQEEESLQASAHAKAEAKRIEKEEREAMAKGKGKGKKVGKGKRSKADRKDKRKKHREEVHGVRLEEQIRQETVGTGGIDICASSKKFKLALALGAAGKPGFCVAGKGEYTMDTTQTVPRGRWVHMTYVAEEKRGRVLIYVDGRCIGYRDHVKCALPMKFIGSDSHSMQGFIQEVRYWAVARNKAEIRQYMHELLPLDAPQHGLLGCWTLEEGEGRYSFDVTEQRYQNRICGRGTKWVTAEDLGCEPPSPSWKARACCKVEIKRAKLAKAGRQQLSFVDCPYGCGVRLQKKDVRFHTEWMCKEIVKEPPDWLHREEVRKRAALAEEGKKQMVEVECPMGCDVILKKKDVQKHIKNDCPYRLGRCMNPGCGAMIPLIRLDAHEKFFCESDYAMAKKAMVRKVREKNFYPTPWRLWDEHAPGVGGGDGADTRDDGE